MDHYDIFISYRTTHSDWVETLARNLKNQGNKVFLDRWALIPGQNFPRNIHHALSNARCAILVATPDASDSGWVQQELDLMLSLKNSGSGFFFIPVVMGQFPGLPFLETVQAVDFGNSSQENYRRAFHRLICGLKKKPPGPDQQFSGDLKLPQVESIDKQRTLAKSEHDFLERVFTQLKCGQPLIILAQADTNTQIYGRALRERAETLYGSANVLHIFPPNSTRADSNAYFGRLAKQCHFDVTIGESWQWAENLADKLENNRDLFLLVTGFENGADLARAELAGELRQLNERYAGFCPVMLGGEKLAALKYAHGTMSLLNIAEELMIPEPDHTDFKTIFAQLYPNLQQSSEQLQEILSFTGGHPRLLGFCLQQGADSSQSCEQLLRDSPLPAQLFTRFREERERVPLVSFLNQQQLGRFDPWPTDELLRKLYWNNLITRKGQNFQWRCEFIRQTGSK